MYEGIVNIFRKLKDPRKGNAIAHDLVETMIIAVLAILCGAQQFTEMELFGIERLEWLRTFLTLKKGIPSHDTFGDIFAALEPSQITMAFAEWTETIRTRISGEVIAIDGKTACASANVGKNKKAVHVISAWAAQNRLVLGQLAAEEKSNEITAIPKLLELLKIKGCIITIDALGTQAKIAEVIIEKGADYILTVKENQHKLHEDIELYFEGSQDETFESETTNEKSHGRIEERKIEITRNIEWLDPEHKWRGLSGIARLSTKTEKVTTGKVEISTQYLIFSSKTASAAELLAAKRAHWGVENRLHWRLDVVYNEDNCRVREGNAAVVFNAMRHLTLNLLTREKTSKGGTRAKQFRCALSNDYLETVLGIS